MVKLLLRLKFQAMKFAEALHDSLGDPAFVDGIQNLTDDMISKEKAKEIKVTLLGSVHIQCSWLSGIQIVHESSC